MADTTQNSSSAAEAIGALGALGIAGYELSQGQAVSATLGPGGASLIQTGPASTQTTIFLVVLALGLIAVLAYIFIK